MFRHVVIERPLQVRDGAVALQLPNDAVHPHREAAWLTLLDADEYARLGQPPLEELEDVETRHIYESVSSDAAATAHDSTFVWNHANAWRRQRGFSTKIYHAGGAHDPTRTLCVAQQLVSDEQTREALLDSASRLGVAALDHLFLAVQQSSTGSVAVAQRMITRFPDSFKSYLRLATVYEKSAPKIVCLALAQACRLNPDLVPNVAKRLGALRDRVSFGPTVTLEELDTIPLPLRATLLRSWTSELSLALASTLWTAPTQSRDRSYFATHRMPRFFSWVYPGRVAGMSTPRCEQDINVLLDLGFDHVLSLAAESPLDAAWFRFKPIKHVFVPLENYGHPTLEEMDSIVQLIQQGGTWLVHCGGGVGRAGTVLACLMCLLGRGDEDQTGYPVMDAGAAIAQLRTMRPRSLESESQERFVSAFVSHRWKCATSSSLPEPVSALKVDLARPLTASLDDPSVSTVIVMIGTPGSGKSWLARAIAKRRGQTEIVSQDRDGRAACERHMGTKHKEGILIILDRCNPRREERCLWLQLMISPRRKIAIFFDVDAALCKQRMDRRLGHPTIRAGQGGNAQHQMQREMSVPTLQEGFDALLTITSMSAAREALQLLTPSPPLLKFPRTPHLFDAGAATSDDVILDDSASRLTGNLVIEEKIDGANMGFSLDFHGQIRCQNRSHWISSADHRQFKPLDAWLALHASALHAILARDDEFPERFVLYGEWMVARHSVHYDKLPSHFVAFDLYDRLLCRFASRSALAMALRGSDIARVPLLLTTDIVSREQLLALCQQRSLFSTGTSSGNAMREGIYVRFEDDQRRYTLRRAKVVRPDFIAGNAHWSRLTLIPNLIACSDASSTRTTTCS